MAKKQSRRCKQCRKVEETFSKNIICQECFLKNKKLESEKNDIKELESFGYQDIVSKGIDNHGARIFEVLNPDCGHKTEMTMCNFRTVFTRTGILSCSICGGKRRAEMLNTSEIAVENRKKTWLANYGVEFPMMNKEFQSRLCDERFERVGYRNPQQCLEVQQKTQKHRTKKYILPSGKQISYQGYENIAIISLLEKYKENEFETQGGKNIPTIWYEQEGVRRRYYPDIYIPKEHKIIEVKSSYTYERFLDKNILKKEACIKNGYNFEFWICSNKELLEILS